MSLELSTFKLDDQDIKCIDEGLRDSLSTVAYSGEYDDLTNKPNLSLKQNVTDNTLTTTDKTVPGAINELNSNLTELGSWQDVSSQVAVGFNPTKDGYLKIIMNPSSVADAYIHIVSSDANENFAGAFATCNTNNGFIQVTEVTVSAGVTYTRIADVNNTAKIMYRALH